MNFIIWLIVGGVCGWLASLIMRTDAQQGIIINIVVAILIIIIILSFNIPFMSFITIIMKILMFFIFIIFVIVNCLNIMKSRIEFEPID